MNRLTAVVATLLALAATPLAAQDAALYAALRAPNHVGLMRHATAPGMDDPPEFRLGNCATQRNLSPGGRAQAAAIGVRLRANGIARARLVSSQWCRTQETARLLGLGAVETLPSLNSLVSYPGKSAEMTAATKAWLQKQNLSGPTILVTHQVNISALVGEAPLEGEIVVAERTRSGELRVVGTIAGK